MSTPDFTDVSAKEILAMYQDLQGKMKYLENELEKHRNITRFNNENTSRWANTHDPERITTPFTFKPVSPGNFHGKQDESLDAWLFQVEQYIQLCSIPPHQQVIFVSSLLRDNAAIWWRNQDRMLKLEGEQNTMYWPEFTEALRQQFNPVNMPKRARDKLEFLKQKDSVHNYVFEYQSLMLEIPDMSEADRLDRFVRGLKSRTKQEVDGRDPATLMEAIKIAERFDANTYVKPVQPRISQPFRNNIPKPDYMELDAIIKNRSLTEAEKEYLRKIGGCFYCRERGHRASECLKRNKLNSINSINRIEYLNNNPVNNLNSVVENTLEIKNDKFAQYIRPIHAKLNPLNNISNIYSSAIHQQSKYNLLQIEGRILGFSLNILIDSGASNNFLSIDIVRKLNLNPENSKPSSLIFPNGSSQIINLALRNVPIEINQYKDNIDFDIADLPHYSVILGRPWLYKQNPQINWRNDDIFIKYNNQLINIAKRRINEKDMKSTTIPTTTRLSTLSPAAEH